jgi:hypothetical protein
MFKSVLNNGSAFPIIIGVDGSQFAAVDIDHNSTSPDNPTPIVPPDGSLAGLLSLDLGTFAPHTVYSLTGSLGFPAYGDAGSLDVGLALGTGAPTLADVFPPPGQPGFAFDLINGNNFTSSVMQDFTATLNTDEFPSLVGQPINVSLIYHSEATFGREAFFDDVRLSSAAAAPELSSLSWQASEDWYCC